MPEHVMMATEGDQVADHGRATYSVGLTMIEVAVRGRHPTAWKDAASISSLDETPLTPGGTAPGDAIRHW
jgi:hypothetical protein